MVRIDNYNIRLGIAPEESSVAVEASVKINLENDDVECLTFSLHKEFLVDYVKADGALSFDFSSDLKSSNPFMLDARTLKIHLPKNLSRKKTLLLKLKYSGPVKDLTWKWKVNRVTWEWTELGLYSAWFPVNTKYGEFTYSVLVDVPSSHRVVGLGEIEKTGKGWFLVQKEKVNDIVIIISPKLKTSVLKKTDPSVILHYVELNEVLKDYLRKEGKWLLEKYRNWFGITSKKGITVVILPKFRIEYGGYTRKGFVVLCPEENLDEDFFRYIAHEIAHLWWLNAPTDSWEDWLNESFAEYSALMALREKWGNKTFQKFIRRKSKKIQELPSIVGLRRDDENAYQVLYNKGPILLNKLESRIGKKEFLKILDESSARKVKLTRGFLDILGCISSAENKEWFKKLLET